MYLKLKLFWYNFYFAIFSAFWGKNFKPDIECKAFDILNVCPGLSPKLETEIVVCTALFYNTRSRWNIHVNRDCKRLSRIILEHVHKIICFIECLRISV